ncbi:hypothetical protein HN51_044111 [Arachis hypogaea]|uniref:E3 SUMO-protein ligase MMS21 n=1 Tax=Arachis hypogaea TaxID=3818 RepID=UPI000DEDF1FC|nr:E3 SUMO-protein ligase MMS21 isoform X2 [Arachis hypogaea]QHN96265.1 E3 SUMO-protein ligase [Arachis hypogaea]
MASSSHGDQMRIVATQFCSDDQTLIAHIRKTMTIMKEIAVEFEKHNESDKVKELEEAVLELADLSEDSVHLSSAVQAIANGYQPKEEVNNFRKLLEDEVSKLKGQYTTSDPNSNPLVRQFKEAVWKVHHEGQPMPGEEQEDIVMTSTQSSILNMTCPLTGKPVTELEEPVRSVECKHIYEKRIIMQYIKSSNRCPISGCPKKLRADRVVQDALLLIEIEELRKVNKETEVEDFTLLNEDD